MKKGLFICTLLFFSATVFAQNQENNTRNNKYTNKLLLDQPNAADQAKIDANMQARVANNANANKTQGGVISAKMDFTSIIYGLYSANLTGSFISITPDSSTIFGYNDGGSTVYSNNTTHGVGAVLDVNFPGFQGNEFDENDMVTIDTILFTGLYFLLNPAQTNDKIKITLLNSDQPQNVTAFGRVFWMPGTFPNLNPADTAFYYDFTYEGDSAHGVKGGLLAQTVSTFNYNLSHMDTTGGTHTFKIPTGGITYDAGLSIGVFIEYIPSGLTTSDTCDLVGNTGTINAFRMLSYTNASANDDNAYFMEFHTVTNNSNGHFLFADTRYKQHSGTSDWRNEYTNVNPYWSHDIWFHVSGTSSVSTPEFSQDIDYTLYPNPNNGNFTLRFGDVTEGDYTVRLVNIVGQEVSNEVIEISNNSEVPFNFSNLEKGMYLLNISGNGMNTAQRITIQ